MSTPYNTCKQTLVFKGKHYIFSSLCFFGWLLFLHFPIPVLASLALLLTPIFLVIDSIELSIEPQIDSVYFY